MIRPLLAALLLVSGSAHALAEGDGAPRRRSSQSVDRGDRVIRTPDTSNVPADLTPRQRRDLQIMVDPYARRRGEDDSRTPRPRRSFER